MELMEKLFQNKLYLYAVLIGVIVIAAGIIIATYFAGGPNVEGNQPKDYLFKCAKCGHEFRIDTKTAYDSFPEPDIAAWRADCPKCGAKRSCAVNPPPKQSTP